MTFIKPLTCPAFIQLPTESFDKIMVKMCNLLSSLEQLFLDVCRVRALAYKAGLTRYQCFEIWVVGLKPSYATRAMVSYSTAGECQTSMHYGLAVFIPAVLRTRESYHLTQEWVVLSVLLLPASLNASVAAWMQNQGFGLSGLLSRERCLGFHVHAHPGELLNIRMQVITVSRSTWSSLKPNIVVEHACLFQVQSPINQGLTP